MKNQRLRQKKLNKKRKCFNEYLKKERIKRNTPKIIKSYKKPILKNVLDKNGNFVMDSKGRVKSKQVGVKIVKYKVNKFKYGYNTPISKKFRIKKDDRKGGKNVK